MGNIGVYIELKDNDFKKSNKESLGLAKSSKNDVIAIVFSNDISSFQDELKGIQKVVQVKGSDLSYQPDLYADTIASITTEMNLTHLLGISSAQGKDLFPRVSAKVADSGLINDCIDVDFDNNLITKPVYAGKLLSQFKVTGTPVMLTIRPNVFPVTDGGSDGTPEIVTKDVVQNDPKTHIKEIIKSATKKIDLQEAEVIVSGGRGMKSQENFAILEELAKVLNAGVGASRAAVDSGFATSDMQVGQTGKVVNPKLYIACGISGAIQHFVGMKTSKVIVAINKDPEAPILKKADYGIVGDLFEAVPILQEELKKVL